MILACKNICKTFGVTTILNNVSFHLEKGERAGLVGINGAGKTTLFRILAGELEPDNGDIITPNQVNIGYLSQQQNLNSNLTIYDEMLNSKQNILELQNQLRNVEHKMKHAKGSKLDYIMNEYSDLQHKFELLNGYSYKSEIEGVLKGLGFERDELSKHINTLSGGEKTRVSLAKLLLTKPEILLLDEPTNHLDMVSINWLEGYINNYDGSLLIISHDRYFLDRTVDKIVELENTESKVYNGNYSFYANKKAAERDLELKHYYNQQKEIQKQEETISQLRVFNREKSLKRAKSREKALEKIDRLDKPQELKADMNLSFEPRIISGNDVLNISDVSKGFDSVLFSNVSIDIKKGETIALIGDNGTGKTTLFKLITKELVPDAGEVKLGTKVNCGYYDQEHQNLNIKNSLIDEISDAYPNMKTSEIRNVLAAFLFTGDDVFKNVSQLSGGEKGRLSLAKLMLSKSNFLLLDEPTNHLDIISKEVLESALKNYTGTILYISHDRYFINKTADRVIELTSSGISNYLGNYDYYLEKKAQLEESQFNEVKSDNTTISTSKEYWLKSKEEQATERKRLAKLSETEEKIIKIEEEIKEIEHKLCLEEVYTDYEKLSELNNSKETLETKLISLYKSWENLTQ
ncbi:MAG: ATP-binding cassette domain-containing protein [Eubacteriales bacterium]